MLKNSSHNFYHYFFIQVLHDRVQNRRKSAFLPIERAKSKSCSILFFRCQILSRSLVTIMSQIRSLSFCHTSSKNESQSDPDLEQIIFISFLEHIFDIAGYFIYQKVPPNFPSKCFATSNKLFCILIAFLHNNFSRCQILKKNNSSKF